MYKFIRFNFSGAEHLALLFLLLTILLIVWQKVGMSHTIIIDRQSGYDAWLENDHSVGGSSIGNLTQVNLYHLKCQIANTTEYPFCHLIIPLAKMLKSGLDLSVFKEVHLTLRHDGGLRNKIDIHLNHFYLTVPGEVRKTDYKVHQYSLSTETQLNTYRLPLNDFVVPSWWAYFQDLPASEYRPTLSNVKHLVVSTTSGQGIREENIYVSRIVFHGKWISAEMLHQTLLWVWISTLLIYLVVRAVRLSNEVTTQVNEKKQLEKLNYMLDIRSKEFETMAKHDQLTGIYNRAGMHDIIKYNLKQYQRSRVPFSIVLLDIDNFKDVNDTYGHAVGDTALSNLAKLISQRCRNNDSLARWGGEEFLLVCANSKVKDAAILSEDLRKLISSTELIEQQTITCSMGIAQFSGSDIDELFERADEALYKAKTRGRNRVVCSDGDRLNPDN
jgi:diguanylate cyclase (GGDEF)-like protein